MKSKYWTGKDIFDWDI